jgi:rfaE bifunctional protein kinase chain/domain
MEEILHLLDRMAQLRVLVIGDTILDEYQYCEPMGKSNKDPALTALYQSRDLFAGGVLAVANHAAGFAGEVRLVSVLGEDDPQETFIHSQLLSNIQTDFAYQPGAPTLTKRRFVDGYSFNKLFELYLMDDSGLPEERDRALQRIVADCMKDYDLVIMADYGHGAVSEGMVRTVCAGHGFVAVNTQANSGNRGFHTVTRYPRADYVCIAEHEICLEMRKRNGRIEPMMDHLANVLQTTQFVVTRGRKGCIVLNRRGEFVAVPAFARHVVDRVGAGDAFFAVTAMASVLGESNEIIGFLGNVAGSLAVGTLGNKKPIDKISMKKNIVSLMK